MKMPRKILWMACALAAVAWAGQSLACPVCFGDTDDPILDGLQASVLFMVGVTYFLILSGVAAFILLRLRARRLAENPLAGNRVAGQAAGSNAKV